MIIKQEGLLLGRFFGVNVHARPGWFVMLGLFAWLLGDRFFAPRFEAGAGVYLMGLLAGLLVFACVVAHEFGHALAARARGIETESISLHFLHGAAGLKREPDNAKDDFAIALAGPLVNVGLAMAFFWILKYRAPDLLEAAASGAIDSAVLGAGGRSLAPSDLNLLILLWANVLLAVFNLVPAFPLDGGRLVRAALWGLTGSIVKATRWASATGRVGGCAMAGLGIGLMAAGDLGGGLAMTLIGLFVNSAAKKARLGVELREGLKDITAGQLMSEAPAPLASSLSLDDAARELLRLDQRFMPVVDYEGEYMGMVGAEEFAKFSRDDWPSTTLQGVILGQAEGMRWLCRELTVAPDAEGLRVYAYLRHNPFGKLPVLSGQRLVGVISRNRLLALLREKGIEF